MKKTKKWITAVVAVLSLGLTSTAVWAGSKQQHRWEGVAIGVGAAIVGSALINHHAYGYHSGPPVAFSFNYRENHRYPSRYCGYRKPHRGGHDDHWRTYDRGHPSMGHRHDRHVHGNRHHGKWQPRDRGPHDDRRGHSRGHGRPRY